MQKFKGLMAAIMTTITCGVSDAKWPQKKAIALSCEKNIAIRTQATNRQPRLWLCSAIHHFVCVLQG